MQHGIITEQITQPGGRHDRPAPALICVVPGGGVTAPGASDAASTNGARPLKTPITFVLTPRYARAISQM